MKPLYVIHAQNTLGEGVTWDAERQRLLWTDIRERQLFRYDPENGRIEAFQTPEPLCSFGLMQESDRLLGAFASGIGSYELGSKTIEWLLRPHFADARVRFNDGRVDRQGRFWAGTMVEGAQPSALGELYRIGHDARSAILAQRIAISNGICWSPDNRRMYFADSALGTIFVYDFVAESGEIANRRVFAQAPPGACPDGANVDSEGYVWSAQWGAGRVIRYAPDGNVERAIEIPTQQPTCLAFGGPDLRLLFITSARLGLEPAELARQPQAGDVFVYEAPAPGLRDPRFSSTR